jgi:hypothetical protein
VDDRDENDNGLFRLSENISFFSDILKNSFDTSPNSAILPCLFYIAAYCAHSLIKFVNCCENCLTYITTNSDFVINFTNCGENDSANVGEYLKKLTRDALKNSPLNYSLKLLLELISDKCETEFPRNDKQRIILRELTMLKLEKYLEEINDKCIFCNKSLKSILILK